MDRFPRAGRFGKGYQPAQVDAFCDLVERSLGRGGGVAPERIRKAGFDLVRGGYDVEAVDAQLDALESRAVEVEDLLVGSERRAAAARESLDALREAFRRPPGERFPRTPLLRRGYDPDDVDAFTASLASTLAGEDGPGVEAVRAVLFRPRHGGYDEDAVDDCLDRVVDVLLRTVR